MMSDENLTKLEEKKYQYIVAAKLCNLPNDLTSTILDEKNYQPQAIHDHFG